MAPGNKYIIKCSRHPLYKVCNIECFLVHRERQLTPSVSDNVIGSWNSAIFSRSQSLMSLDLGRNYLNRLRKGWFTSLTSLVSLDLRENRMNYIHPHTFGNLSHLHSLCLSSNVVSSCFTQMYCVQ